MSANVVCAYRRSAHRIIGHSERREYRGPEAHSRQLVRSYRLLNDNEVVVLGRLTAQGVSKCQFGKSKITRTREGKAIVSLGDDLKAAATDSLKKAATLFGIGLHLYFDQPANGGRTEAKPRSSNGGQPSGNGQTDNGRLTAKQLSAIFSLAKAKDWSNKDVRDFTHEMFGKMPDFLTKKEASAMIQHLQGSPDA